MATGRDFDTELLVLQCQEGDTEALGALVTRWQDRVWRHALRLTGKEDVAWDVVQETFLAVGKGVVRLPNPAAFPAWVYQLASHKARDWLRRDGSSSRSLMVADGVTPVPVRLVPRLSPRFSV